MVKKEGDTLAFGHLDYFDVKNAHDKRIIDGSFLSSLVNHEPVSVAEALDDLKHNFSNLIENINLSKLDEFTQHEFMESRYKNGDLSFLDRNQQLYQIKDCNVINLEKSEDDLIAELERPPCKLAENAPNLPASAVIYKSALLSAPSSAILFSNAPDFPDTTLTLIPVLAVNFSYSCTSES